MNKKKKLQLGIKITFIIIMILMILIFLYINYIKDSGYITVPVSYFVGEKNIKVKNVVNENGKIVFYCKERTSPIGMYFHSTDISDKTVYWDVKCKIGNRLHINCKSSFDHFTYGELPEGYYEDSKAIPLVHGKEYCIDVPAKEGGYSSCFIFNPENNNIEKEK